MQTYYLVLRDDPSVFATISPTQMQAIVQRYVKWREENAASGKVKNGEKLSDGVGRVLRRTGGKLVTSDGPFMEAKEVLGGFFVVQAKTCDEAQAIAETCPHLEFGSIEIREVEPT